MTEIQVFNSVWKFEGQRGKATQERYEHRLFEIWKSHHEYNKSLGKGFQVKCHDKTDYNILEKVEDAGLLKRTRNYLVGKFNRSYIKNHSLFNHVFRNTDDKYGNWLKSNKQNSILQSKLLEAENIDIDIIVKNKINIIQTVIKRTPKNYKNLCYDLSKLKSISVDMLKHYKSLYEKLNTETSIEDMKLLGFLKFDEYGLPNGRPYSLFCFTLNDKKKQKGISSNEKRSEFLHRVGLSDYFEVYDIKSQVPKINYLFHTGDWKNNNYDFYSEIIKDTEMIKHLDYEIQRGETEYTEYNDSMKQLFMRIYFEKVSDEKSYLNYYKEKSKRDIELKENYQDFKRFQNNFVITLDIWKEICNSTRKVCGKPIHNLIWWYCSLLEAEVRVELLNRGKKVYNVYDGFYFNQDIGDEIDKIVMEKSKFIFDNFMKPIWL